jgi:trk system potassium uptake protein TrkH
VDKLVPKTGSSAKILYMIYIGLCVLQFILQALGGMPWFDNLTTVFGTAGTGGFGIKGDSIAGYSPYLQVVITIFMSLFGVNFSLYYLIVTGKWKHALKNEEFRLYWLIQLIAITLIALNIRGMYATTGETIRHAAFQVSTIITTTGFATTNFDLWPEFSKWILLLLMFVGASAGSTGGGIKVSRILLMVKASFCERKKLLNPRKISLVRMDGRVVQDDTIRGIWQYMGFYLVIAALSVLLLSLDGFGIETTFSAMAACLNNIGPGFGVCGPAGNFSTYSNLSKIVLCIDMLLGRLEIIPFMMLFAPSNWSKN